LDPLSLQLLELARQGSRFEERTEEAGRLVFVVAVDTLIIVVRAMSVFAGLDV
jgi:hypothetical protein